MAPIRVTMNDGSFYDIDGVRDVAVDSTINNKCHTYLTVPNA